MSLARPASATLAERLGFLEAAVRLDEAAFANLFPKTIVYVDATAGSDINGDGSAEHPFGTIQTGIDNCPDGSVVAVAQGTYTENIVLTDRSDLIILCQTPVGRGITYNARPNIAPATGIAVKVAQCRRIYFRDLYFYSTNAVAVQTDGEGVTFDNCESSSDAAEEYKLLSDTSPNFTGSGTTWIRCILDSGVNGIKSYVRTAPGGAGQATNCVIEDCDFYGHSGADIAGEAADNVLFDGWRVTNNRFMTRNKAVYLAMKGAGADASTNVLISGNFFADDAGLDSTKIAIPTGAVFAGNFAAAGVVNGASF